MLWRISRASCSSAPGFRSRTERCGAGFPACNADIPAGADAGWKAGVAGRRPGRRPAPQFGENPAGWGALDGVAFYRRRLPHLQPGGKPLFITWHLAGSLPHHRFPPSSSLSAGKAFVWMDRYLDSAASGPTWLLRDEIARMPSGISLKQLPPVVRGLRAPLLRALQTPQPIHRIGGDLPPVVIVTAPSLTGRVTTSSLSRRKPGWQKCFLPIAAGPFSHEPVLACHGLRLPNASQEL